MSSGNSSTCTSELDLDGLSNRISSTIGNFKTWSSKSLTQNQYHIVVVGSIRVETKSVLE